LGTLLPRRHLRCWCCLETAPWVAAESKTMSGFAGVNAEVLPRCVSCFYQSLTGNCLAGTQQLCPADPGPGEGEESPCNGLFERTSGFCHHRASSGLRCGEVTASESPTVRRSAFGFKTRGLPLCFRGAGVGDDVPSHRDGRGLSPWCWCSRARHW